MRVFLILSESYFYKPNFVAEFLKNTKDDVVGAALVTKSPKKADLSKYLKNNWFCLYPTEIVKLVALTLRAAFTNIFTTKNSRDFYSVKKAFKIFGINYFEIENNLNKKEYLDKIDKKDPDVIISSNPLIFGEKLLKLPKICCLNRHSSLLPSYGGLLPVFHAYRSGEKYIGVSVHTMVKEIDKGVVLGQKRIRIKKEDTIANLYEKAFTKSVEALMEALDKVRDNNFSPCEATYSPSYFSFPTKEDWKEFRKKGGRFI